MHVPRAHEVKNERVIAKNFLNYEIWTGCNNPKKDR